MEGPSKITFTSALPKRASFGLSGAELGRDHLGMSHCFQIRALPNEPFERFYNMSSGELVQSGVVVYDVDSVPGYPCRVSLQDAPHGAEVLLVNYEHQPAETPFQSKGPIFVRRHAIQAQLVPNEVPEMLLTRPLSVRGYDKTGMMVGAEVIEGQALEEAIDLLFYNPDVEYLHVHFARRGCFACKVERT